MAVNALSSYCRKFFATRFVACASLILDVVFIALLASNCRQGGLPQPAPTSELQESALLVVDHVSMAEGSAMHYQEAVIQRVVREGWDLKAGDNIVIVFPGDEHPVPPNGWMVEVVKRPGFDNQYFRKN